MLTLCVRELRFNDVLLRVEELCELVADAGPDDSGDGAPTGGAIETRDPPPKLTPALAAELEGGCCCCCCCCCWRCIA